MGGNEGFGDFVAAWAGEIGWRVPCHPSGDWSCEACVIRLDAVKMRVSRLLSAVGIVLAGVLALPTPSLAASIDDYVVVERDGDVQVRSLTPAQAEQVSIDPDVRIVAPDQPMGLLDDPAPAPFDVPAGATAGQVIPGRWIVRFDSGAAASMAATSLAGRLTATYTDAIDGFAADLTDDQVTALRANPDVVSIEPDRVVAVDDTQNGAPWGLDRIDQRTLPLNGTFTYSQTGAGVTAYVIDTGVYSAHREFAGRIAAGYTVVGDGRGTEDCHGHGTHVAGTVAGTTYGVAKQATIVPVRVLNCYGSGSFSGVIAALDWIVSHHQDGTPAVANMSLGGGASSTVNAAVARATADGVSVVVAAGNSNMSACSFSPASAPSAITVGATTSSDARASYSNFGSCLDVFAPGSSILSAYPFAGGVLNPGATAYMSGTSMASPHVAGVVAAYLSTNPTATPAAVATVLSDAATPGIVANPGTGSPNLMIHSASFEPAPPSAPSAPANLRATAGNARVTLTWTAPPAWGSTVVTDYIVEYSANFGSTWTSFDDGVSTVTSAVVTDLANNVVHWFRVKAVNSVGIGAASSVVNATPFVPTAPTAPRYLSATAGVERATLRWSAPLSNGGASITDYVIDVSTDLGATWTRAADSVSASTSATITGLVAGETHTFRVAAVNSVGTGSFSGTASVIPWATSTPSVPRSVRASAGMYSLSVSWSAPAASGGAAIDSYLVDWSTDGTTWQGLVTVSGGTRWTTLSDLVAGTSHTVRVRAVNVYGTGPAATATGTPVAPAPPSSPRSPWVRTGYNSASLYWLRPSSNGGSAITGYRIEWSTDAGLTWDGSTVVADTQRSVRIDGLEGGVRHDFRVVAINAIGASNPSSVVTATPLAVTAPSAPRNFYGFLSGTSAYLTWSTPFASGGSVITGYEVSQSTDGGATWSLAANIVAPTRSTRLDNLVGGTTYLFRVVARNAVGTSPASGTVTLQPRITGTPNPPSSVTATLAATTVNLSWTAVTSSYAPVTDYVIETSTNYSGVWTVHPDSVSADTSVQLTDRTPDVALSIRVRAVNSYGTGPASGAVTVIPRMAPVAPGAPRNVAGVPGDGSVAVSWASPESNGGASITSYSVTSNPDSFTCQSSTTSCVVTGLTNGTAYTFSVTATNSAGTGPASAESDPVTPVSGATTPIAVRSWGLDRVDQRALPLDSRLTRMGSGAGVNVYVVDTGVYAGHSDLAGRVASGYSSINDGLGSDDCDGHGTHVAGTIAGTQYGFAHLATVVPVRVLNCWGSGSTATVVAGINWAISHHDAGTPAVLNMSLGGGYDAVLNDAVSRAVDDGITVVVAAGNSNADSCNYSPASAPSALTVGATSQSDARSYFSNWGTCLDIFAPGSSITSLGTSSSTATATYSGTSMASPHVAGVAAQLLGNNRSLTPAQVSAQMLSSATANVVFDAGAGSPNRLLYAQPASTSNSSADSAESVLSAGDDSVFAFTYGSDRIESAAIVTTTPPPAAPVEPDAPVATAPAPRAESSAVAAPMAVTAVANLSVKITSVRRVGGKIRVVVAAPAGAKVTLWRNGKKVATNRTGRFTVPVGKVAVNSFVAVAKTGAVMASSARLVVRTASLRLR